MNRIEIEECNDIDKLKKLSIAQYKLLFYIGEVLVDESKQHLTPEDAIKKIRTYMTENQNYLNLDNEEE